MLKTTLAGWPIIKRGARRSAGATACARLVREFSFLTVLRTRQRTPARAIGSATRYLRRHVRRRGRGRHVDDGVDVEGLRGL